MAFLFCAAIPRITYDGGIGMGIRITSAEGVVNAYLLGDIDHHTAKEMRAVIDDALESGSPKLLVLDFRDVSFMDSSGIGLVMGRYKAVQAIGGELRIANPAAHIRRVMRLAGLDRLAAIEDAAKPSKSSAKDDNRQSSTDNGGQTDESKQ